MLRRRIAAIGLVLALGACGDDTGTTPIDDDSTAQMATVEGRIDRSSTGGGAAAASSVEASTVAVAQLSSSGSVEVLAEADVQADGSYTIENVPANRTDLVVIARMDGEETGRVLLYGETRSGATLTAEPLDFETTVEGEAYARARATGRPAGSAAEVALMVRMDESSAEAAVSSDATLDTLTEAFVEAGETFEAALEASGGVALDARARSEAMLTVAQNYAVQHHGGASAEAAHRTFIEQSLDAWIDAGVSAELIAEGSAAGVTVIDDLTANLTSAVRADASLGTTLLNLEARERLAADAESEQTAGSGSAVADVMTSAQTEISVTADPSVLSEIYSRSSTEAHEALRAAIQNATADASAAQRLEIDTAAEVAIEAANLEARFTGTVDAAAVAEVMADYRSAVVTAVDVLGAAMAEAGTVIDSAAMADVFIAAGASGSID